ncbi:MAG: SOS response-associated peptidase [Planctomycetes bacterium]|nr:SOS response-associated peptidase [Planctomycetota bacterium]
MCGRFANPLTAEELETRLHAKANALYARGWKPTWNAAPSQHHPVLILSGGERRLGLMRWGWKPAFLAGRDLVNARGEEAHGKRTFAEAFLRRRCLVPASAFYEWQEQPEGGANKPFAIARVDREPFTIAGLWCWLDAPEGQEREPAFLLLTVPANATIAPVHHRQACIIAPADRDRWLDPTTPIAAVRALVVACPDAELEAWPVSKAVNAPKNDGPELLALAIQGQPR